MQHVVATNTAPGQITAGWQSTWNGAFTVFLLDMTTNTAAGPFVTNDTFMVFNGLVSGHVYVVSVHDDQTVMASNAVKMH